MDWRLVSCFFVSLVGMLAGECPAAADERFPRQKVEAALRRAVDFFRNEVAVEGGYVWRYSADLKHREGERAAGEHAAWVQPPGTPTVGAAFLEIYLMTGDDEYLEAARETARALVKGQLESGGWDYRIEFDPEQRRKYAYRVEPSGGKNNTTTLDDDTTQSALRFLMRTDQALELQDQKIHEAAEYALKSLLEAQYPNGAWPQRYDRPPQLDQFPIQQATYPKQWSRTHPDHDYRGFYTLNDSTLTDMISTMLLAAEIYERPQYREAALRGGDFLLLAQMPDPQPAWAQQYNRQMEPAWARRFEPPAITGGESQGAIRLLLDLYRQTGEQRYLRTVPAALDYLKASELPNRQLARFYELKTNRPLYFTKDYQLTYSDSDLPTHYAFTVSSKIDQLQKEYQRLVQEGPDKNSRVQQRPTVKWSKQLQQAAASLVQQLDHRGAWTSEGYLRSVERRQQEGKILESKTFAENVVTLARLLAAQENSGTTETRLEDRENTGQASGPPLSQ